MERIFYYTNQLKVFRDLVVFAHVGGLAPGNTSVFVLDLGWGGVGWDVNVQVNLQKQLMLRTRGVGGGMGWDVNAHVKLQKHLMLRGRGVALGWPA